MFILQRLMYRINKINNVLLFIITLLIVSISSIIMRNIEPTTFPNLFESLWWVMTTMTTVGYGDYFPATVIGKVYAMFLYIIGIGVLGVVIGKVVGSFGMLNKLKEEGKLNFHGKDHIVIVGWSKKAEYAVKDILSKQKTHIVIIDQLPIEPFVHNNVHFVSGNAATEETIDAANLKRAKSVIIFADDSIDNPLLIDGKTMILAASIEQYAPNVKTIIEVIKEEHLRSFSHVKVDEFILSNKVISNLAVEHL